MALPQRIRPKELAHSVWVITSESVRAFLRNDDLRQASSLAFYTALALLPALLLLSIALAKFLSSPVAIAKTSDLVSELFPTFSDSLLREVKQLAKGSSASNWLDYRVWINVGVLVWSVMPLVAAMRATMNLLFKNQPRHSFLLVKFIDLVVVVAFIVGLALVAGLDVVLRYLRGLSKYLVVPTWLDFTIPLVLTVLLLFCLYFALTPKVRARHLLVGALVTAALWFVLRPGFSLFLTYNPEYGKAFGSFKSIFTVIIWLYYSMAVFLFGAEVMAALHRKEAIFIRRLMSGKGALSLFGRERFLVSKAPGETFFQEGEEGTEMYFVTHGSVSILREGQEIARIPEGKYFGEMSFLLDLHRTATAVAAEPVECVVINQRNMDALMREHPQTIQDMLKEMARRLSDTNRGGVRLGATGAPGAPPAPPTPNRPGTP